MKAMFCLLFVAITASRVQAQDSLALGVFGSGGLAMTDSAQYVLIGTVGQSAVGRSLDTNTVLNSGFWYSVGSIITGVQQEEETLPKKFALYPNYPNPFNPSTTIRFDLPKAGNVRLTVYNILGQEVRQLVNGRMEAGRRQVTWDGTNRRGTRVSSGVYICRIVYGDQIKSRKMMVLK
jgi:hypothetical protein